MRGAAAAAACGLLLELVAVVPARAAEPGGGGGAPGGGGGAPGERGLYDYARALSDRAQPEYGELAFEELVRYQRRHPEGEFADDVRFRMARLEATLGRPHRAAARYLELLLLHPGSLREAAAGEELERLLSSRALRELRPRYLEARRQYQGGATSVERRQASVRALLLIDDRDIDDLTASAGLSLLESYPEAAGNDLIALALADLERRRGSHRRAVAAYERVVHLYPASSLVARALLAEGEVHERGLDEPREALAAYRRVAQDLAALPEAGAAWFRMGEVERLRLGRPEIAVRDYDQVLTRHPDHPDAFDALLAKAAAISTGLKEPQRAERVLVEGVGLFARHSRAPEALEMAAALAERELDDRVGAARHLERLASEYPAARGAAEALYRAGGLLEEAGERERAAAVYGEIVRRYPASEASERARRRAQRLARQ